MVLKLADITSCMKHDYPIGVTWLATNDGRSRDLAGGVRSLPQPQLPGGGKSD